MRMNINIDSKDFHFNYNKAITSAFTSFFTNNKYYKKSPDYNIVYFLNKKELIELADYIKKDPYNLFVYDQKNYQERVLYGIKRMLMLLQKNEKIKIQFI